MQPQPSRSPGAFALQLPADFAHVIASALADELERRGALTPAATTPYMDVEQAAAYIVSKPQRVYDLISQGVLEPRRDGRRVLLAKQTLDDYLAGEGST